MTAQPVLDLFEEQPEVVVPACGRCGARGRPITVDGVVVVDLHAATLWALHEIETHEREMHGIDHRAWCSGCGCLLGAPRDEQQFEKLARITAEHLARCTGGSVLTRVRVEQGQ